MASKSIELIGAKSQHDQKKETRAKSQQEPEIFEIVRRKAVIKREFEELAGKKNELIRAKSQQEPEIERETRAYIQLLYTCI